jgi:PAS domain S-box-containing protein
MSDRIDAGRGDTVAISSLQQQRARAEEALRAAHDTLRHMVDRSPFGMYVVNADFRLVQVSNGAQKVFQCVRPLLGRDFAEVLRAIWEEPFASEAIERFRQTLATGEPYSVRRSIEQRHDTPEVEAYDWRIERHMLPDGRFGVVCHFYDLTERERILRELRESEEQFRHLADAMPQLVWTADALGMPDYYNARAANYSGIVRRDDGGWDWQPVVHADDMGLTMANWRSAVASKTTYQCEHRVRMADGSFRWHLSRAVPTTVEGTRWFGTATDIHDLRTAQVAQADSEERLRLAAATAKFGVHDYDPTNGHSVWSDELYDIIGIKRGTPVGMELAMRVVHDDDRLRVERAMIAALDPAGTGEFAEEFRIVRQNDGQIRWVLNRCQTFFAVDERGRRSAVRTTGVVIDVTDRRRAEEAMRDADRRKDEFLATLAHELRNPLAAISGAVQVVRRKGDDPAVRANTVDVLQRQVKHLSRLIDDLMDVSRVSRGKVTLQFDRIDLRSAMTQAIETTKPCADDKGLELIAMLPNAPVYVQGDSARLTQVVGNLLNNACKFTDTGGRVEVSLAVDQGAAIVRVRDTGIGIPIEKLTMVFELFAQLDTSLTRTNTGLGIGLSLVRNLVELHGGSVGVTSEGTGKGSEFVVRLPVIAEPVAAPAQSDAPTQDTSATIRSTTQRSVLVVDDNRDSVESLTQLLEFHGFDVHRAYDGSAAVDAFLQMEPDAVLLDIGLPGIDGREVARRIRARSARRRPILVALTGWGQDDDRRKSAEAGFDAHLVKPCDVEALIRLLRDGPLMVDASTRPARVK